MKKFFNFVVLIILISLLFICIKTHQFKNNVNISSFDNNFNVSLKFKGLKYAKAFCLDNEGNYYIAYKHNIQVISKYGKSYDLLKKGNLNINNLKIYSNKLYYVSNSELYCLDLENKKEDCLMKNIPNFGDYEKVNIEKEKNYLYLSIGSATNSGVVGEDNKWLKDKPYNCDIPPKTLTLRGTNFGDKKTGSFVPYGTSNIKGQIIPNHFPGNASIIIYNLKTKESETFAFGIRNVSDMEFNNKDQLIAIVGGMENRGLRPVKGDVDYIYKIKKSTWYGWPDYSGGDPLSSPRFKGKNNSTISFLLDKQPSTSPPAPMYQYKSLNALTSIAIDKNGVLGNKDDIYIYDKNDKKIYSLNEKGVLKDRFTVNNNKANDVYLRFDKNNLNVLNASSGKLYEINLLKNPIKFNIKGIQYYISILFLSVFVNLIYNKIKFQIQNKKSK